jgi:hypothetical protein
VQSTVDKCPAEVTLGKVARDIKSDERCAVMQNQDIKIELEKERDAVK